MYAFEFLDFWLANNGLSYYNGLLSSFHTDACHTYVIPRFFVLGWAIKVVSHNNIASGTGRGWYIP